MRYQISWGYVSCICSWIRLDTEAVHRFAVFVADPRHNCATALIRQVLSLAGQVLKVILGTAA
ncbi:TPA: hypothetical protein L6A88_30335 [Pseudomonas aeruginosa]|nr:hypothetical protein [Pseudomonas aeruginosa]HBP6705868.1 hypothetical protein [Pseudomonas aeruginosa]HBP6743731.1 hypothetical protein [Pseudomonas aeruginosa]